MLPFSIIGGLALASLWLTREDGIWILPFVITVIGITFVLIILKNRKRLKEWKRWLPKILVTILPVVLLTASLDAVRLMNYEVYGVGIYNETDDGYFGKVLKTMYSVKTDEDIQYVTVTRQKLDLLCEHSETLNSIKPYLDASLDGWDYCDRTPGDTQVEDGWFWWALKGAVEDAGYYKDATTANEFYKKVYEELNAEIDAGKLETQLTLPSNLMSPWKSEYFIELPKTMASMAWFVTNFDTVKTVNPVYNVANPGFVATREFEEMTNDLSGTPYTQKYVDRVNAITKIYKATGLILILLAILSYLLITKNLIKTNNKNKYIDSWLLFTGVLCSLIVLIGGVSYNHITACNSQYYMYLSGAYPLLITFSMGCICYFTENRKNLLKKKFKRSNNK